MKVREVLLSIKSDYLSIKEYEQLINDIQKCSDFYFYPALLDKLKKCFIFKTGWLLTGLDYMSLEDRISALTTKDPEKLKVYTDGYDGHCLRSYAYFKEQMPDITEELQKHPEKKVEIINSIKYKYKKYRQESKGYTFALTYNCQPSTLVKNFGCDPEKAQQIYDRFHDLYHVSDIWVNDQMKSASTKGYVTCAFGLRVRTPLLRTSIRGTYKTPKEAEAEFRSAANALGQSFCSLTLRAGKEVNQKVRSSKYKSNIRPAASIHDAMYFLVKDDAETLLWLNQQLVKAVQWQDDPAIWHDQVKLGGEYSIFWPDWSSELTIPNNVQTEEELTSIVKDFLTKYKEEHP